MMGNRNSAFYFTCIFYHVETMMRVSSARWVRCVTSAARRGEPAVVFHPDFSINPIQPGHRFPMAKDTMLYKELVSLGLAKNVLTPTVPSIDDVCLVHDRTYVERFVQGLLSEEEMRSIGLPWSEDLVQRTLIGVGSAIEAARYAVENRTIACMTNGGTHHAHADRGSGWCCLNDQAVACRYVQKYLGVKNVLFLDLDVHLNDGTASIFQDCNTTFSFSMHGAEQSFPAVKYPNNVDILLPKGCSDGEYMEALSSSLPRVLDTYDFDLVLYNAGVDVHAEDSLGSLHLTNDGIEQRERYVIEEVFLKRQIALAVAIGGGYNPDHGKIVDKHILFHKALHDLMP